MPSRRGPIGGNRRPGIGTPRAEPFELALRAARDRPPQAWETGPENEHSRRPSLPVKPVAPNSTRSKSRVISTATLSMAGGGKRVVDSRADRGIVEGDSAARAPRTMGWTCADFRDHETTCAPEKSGARAAAAWRRGRLADRIELGRLREIDRDCQAGCRRRRRRRASRTRGSRGARSRALTEDDRGPDCRAILPGPAISREARRRDRRDRSSTRPTRGILPCVTRGPRNARMVFFEAVCCRASGAGSSRGDRCRAGAGWHRTSSTRRP